MYRQRENIIPSLRTGHAPQRYSRPVTESGSIKLTQSTPGKQGVSEPGCGGSLTQASFGTQPASVVRYPARGVWVKIAHQQTLAGAIIFV